MDGGRRVEGPVVIDEQTTRARTPLGATHEALLDRLRQESGAAVWPCQNQHHLPLLITITVTHHPSPVTRRPLPTPTSEWSTANAAWQQQHAACSSNNNNKQQQNWARGAQRYVIFLSNLY